MSPPICVCSRKVSPNTPHSAARETGGATACDRGGRYARPRCAPLPASAAPPGRAVWSPACWPPASLAGCGGDDDGDEGGQPTGTSTAPAEPLVITVDGRNVDLAGIGTAKPLLADAIRRFGPPSSQREIDGSACHVRWPTGLFAIYANLGGGEPCDPRPAACRAAR